MNDAADVVDALAGRLCGTCGCGEHRHEVRLNCPGDNPFDTRVICRKCGRRPKIDPGRMLGCMFWTSDGPTNLGRDWDWVEKSQDLDLV